MKNQSVDKNKKNNKKKQNIKRKPKKRIWTKILLIFLLLILIAGGVLAYKTYKNGGGISGMLATVVGHDENTKKNLKEFKCLILGISTDEGNDLTDTIIVASYNPNSQKGTLLSIPRDTYTGKNPEKATAYEKINALYSRKHRPDETLEAVNEITGLNIEYYMVIQNEALIKLVDAIGGVTFNVPINMDYDDPSQNLHIHLKAGEQMIDGEKAEQLVRFRHNNNGTSYPMEYGDNDIGRMKTQRAFIMETLKQTAKVENIFKLGQILDVAKENVLTNVDFNVIKDYIPYIVEFNTENLLTDSLPGTNSNNNASGTWVFVHDKKQTKELIQKLFYDRDIQEVTDNATQTDVSKKDIKIEVLDGSGSTNKLQEAVTELEGAGYIVSRTGTTNTTAKTAIVNKRGAKSSVVNNIKDVLGTGVVSESQTSSSKVDVVVILGKDYQ